MLLGVLKAEHTRILSTLSLQSLLTIWPPCYNNFVFLYVDMGEGCSA